MADTHEATFTLVDDARQWPQQNIAHETPSAAGVAPTATAPARKLEDDKQSVVRTQEALDSLVGKEALRVKKTVLKPQDRLIKAGSLNKMGGAVDMETPPSAPCTAIANCAALYVACTASLFRRFSPSVIMFGSLTRF